MKIVILFALLALVLYYRHKMAQGYTGPKPPKAVVPTTSRSWGTQGGLSSYGSASPGSGVVRPQPNLASTWGVGGDYSVGLTGVILADGNEAQ